MKALDGRPRGTIVVADDDTVTLAVLRQILTKANYRVFPVENGWLAYETIRRELPDLALLDWEMPVMNGLDALKALKSDTLTREIPVIMLTSHAFKEGLAFHGGFSDFIVKPIDPHELVARIEVQRRLRLQVTDGASGTTDAEAHSRTRMAPASLPSLKLEAAIAHVKAAVVALLRRGKIPRE